LTVQHTCFLFLRLGVSKIAVVLQTGQYYITSIELRIICVTCRARYYKLLRGFDGDEE
jgi:hypothetical protein